MTQYNDTTKIMHQFADKGISRVSSGLISSLRAYKLVDVTVNM